MSSQKLHMTNTQTEQVKLVITSTSVLDLYPISKRIDYCYNIEIYTHFRRQFRSSYINNQEGFVFKR